ncbi:hypothetical protein MML48_8g00000849 [Holotrichia oblita]|uniref:Uncharacterized protein n=1 Tax=Holotrichia oblita TaxID=644536 RepID=A0ACB9SN03_HOLOL|nr:hypothetical protein MML48_8g00000849 [Holotrichia oblita]
MGRKIKGRKHKGVRDPEKQRETKFLSIRDKINTPPTNPDDQQIPKSLLHVINLKQKLENGQINLKRKRKPKKSRPVTSHPHGIKNDSLGRDVPFFQQEKGETDKHFMYRVNQICKSVIDEAAFANKYGVDITRNPETGQIEKVTKRKKDELELYIKQIKKEKKFKGKKKIQHDSEKSKLTKSQKRQVKLKEKKETKLISNIDEFKTFKDDIKFGEVAHEPPVLPAPRKVTIEDTARPGKRNLLLKTLIDPNRKEKTKMLNKETKLQKISNKVIDRKGKRKDLPHALRRQLEKQQKEVIQAYKELKTKRYSVK